MRTLSLFSKQVWRAILRSMCAALFFVSASAVHAHEYWIEPLNFWPAQGEEVAANLTVGQDFKGDKLAYIPNFAVRAELHDAQGMMELAGNAGDRPALQLLPRATGLNILAYQTTKSRIEFDDFDFFLSYLETEGLSQIGKEHLARNLPETGFFETYSRFAKSLLVVGDEFSGADREVGLRAELVLQDKLAAIEEPQIFKVKMLWEGEGQADVQVKIFSKAASGNDLRVIDVRTNAQGVARFEVEPQRIYLLNSVHMEPVDFEDAKVAWESFWASLTFATP